LRKTAQTVLRVHHCNHDFVEQRFVAPAILLVESFVPLAGIDAIESNCTDSVYRRATVFDVSNLLVAAAEHTPR